MMKAQLHNNESKRMEEKMNRLFISFILISFIVSTSYTHNSRNLRKTELLTATEFIVAFGYTFIYCLLFKTDLFSNIILILKIKTHLLNLLFS